MVAYQLSAGAKKMVIAKSGLLDSVSRVPCCLQADRPFSFGWLDRLTVIHQEVVLGGTAAGKKSPGAAMGDCWP